jgi:hypothetical protein
MGHPTQKKFAGGVLGGQAAHMEGICAVSFRPPAHVPGICAIF